MKTPNAALLHEIRMYSMVLLPALPILLPAIKSLTANHATSGLLCATCLRTKKPKPNKAVCMYEGRSICMEHMGYLS